MNNEEIKNHFEIKALNYFKERNIKPSKSDLKLLTISYEFETIYPIIEILVSFNGLIDNRTIKKLESVKE